MPRSVSGANIRNFITDGVIQPPSGRLQNLRFPTHSVLIAESYNVRHREGPRLSG
jgi:hypothetical protein